MDKHLEYEIDRVSLRNAKGRDLKNDEYIFVDHIAHATERERERERKKYKEALYRESRNFSICT